MKPIIPKGWRRLPKGTLLKTGDECWVGLGWVQTSLQGEAVEDRSIYIRRITPKEKP